MNDFALYFGVLSMLLGLIVWVWIKSIDDLTERGPDRNDDDQYDNNQHTEQGF